MDCNRKEEFICMSLITRTYRMEQSILAKHELEHLVYDHMFYPY